MSTSRGPIIPPPFTLRLDAAFGGAVVVGAPLAPLHEASRTTLLARLHPEEAARASTWADRRVRTYVAGRTLLRDALRALDLPTEGPFLATPRGAPAVPSEVRASVSHKDEVAVALAATATAVQGAHLGVDVEVVTPRSTDITRMVLTDAERHALAGLEPEALACAVLLRFSLKEALYKALDPHVQRYVGFHEVEARPDDDGRAAFTLDLKGGEGPFAAHGTWSRRDDVLITAVRVDLAPGR